MKYILILALACSATAVQAQVMPAPVAHPAAHRIDSANNSTPLLTMNDIIFLRDSVLSEAPYRFAPVIENTLNFLVQRIQLRAAEYNLKAGKK